MPVRIPLKIFVLRQTSNIQTDNAQLRYLDNVTTEDFDRQSDGRILIPNNRGTDNTAPLANMSALSEVFSDDSRGYYVMTSTGEKLYIREKNPQPFPTSVSSTYEFYVNPQRLSPTYQKIQTEVRTISGWEVQHWGDALSELRIEGKSGGMHKRSPYRPIESAVFDYSKYPEGLLPGQSITDSTAWNKLIELKKLYDADHSIRNQEQLQLLGISVYKSFYVGYFTSFTGPTQDASDPYQFSYSFSFKVLYETTTTVLNPTFNPVVSATSRKTLLTMSGNL